MRSLSRAVGPSRLRRTFMSEGFACAEAWEKRFENRLLSKVNLEEMYCDLENKLNHKRPVTAVDVDIFANSIRSSSHIQELEELVHRFRQTARTGDTLESTHHAVVRALHRYADTEDLMRVLNDRLNYGIFPDDYCLIFLMDGFIKKGDFKNAAKVASLSMLQENFENKLVNHLALYSCHKYLLDPVEWHQTVEEKNEEEDDEEEKWVRVKYLRNPFFDDHFDLNDANSLVGKTLLLVGKEVDDVSHQILGAVLYKKYDTAKQLIKEVIDSKGRVYEVCLNLALNALKSLPVEEGEAGEKSKELIASMTSEIENLKSKAVNTEDPLIKIEEEIKKLVKQSESELISKQKETYDKWETVREEVLMDELKEIKRQSRLKEVERRKEELTLKEQKLFFFDNEDKIDMAIENKKVVYPKKWHGKKKKKKSDSEGYIPPEIVKQYKSSP